MHREIFPVKFEGPSDIFQTFIDELCLLGQFQLQILILCKIFETFDFVSKSYFCKSKDSIHS